ncbi:MAG: hypothetical protein M1825_003140 [Sarcosagium campestre]|nr:MAG: hypothetical protein M1825_003140 [Sarcosagium campestre]
MVYNGQPSRGCLVCRKRHIKCDEASPACSYCSKRQITCPGYKSQFDVAWRDQNRVAQKSVQRRLKAVEKTDRHGIERQDLVTVKPLQPPQPPPLSLLKAVQEDYETYAVNFFFAYYVQRSKDVEARRGLFDYLNPVWMQTGVMSPLRHAVAAVSSCLLEAWSLLKPDQPLSLSRSHYQKGIAGLRKHLQSAQVVGDDILVTILMLDVYEGLRSFLTMEPNTSPHLDGGGALVGQRRQRPVASEISQKVILGARNSIVSRALVTKKAVPVNVARLGNVTQGVPETAASRLDDLNVEVANLQADASHLKSETAADFFSLLKKAAELDQRLSVWASTVPSDWGPFPVSGSACIPQSVYDVGLYRDQCDVYKNLAVAFTFNSYRSSRIKLQRMILASLKHLNKAKSNDDNDNSTPDAASMTPMAIIQEMADGMCASVAYHLGNRTKFSRVDDKTVKYPHLAGAPVSDEFCSEANATGGWLLATRLPEFLSLDSPLRSGQLQWLRGQMKRVMSIYAIQPYKS